MSPSTLHPLLARQLRKSQAQGLDASEQFQALLKAVGAAYAQFDEDRALMERSLELSSRELLQANTDLRALVGALPDLVIRVDAAGTIIDLRGAPPASFFETSGPLVGSPLCQLLPADVGQRVLGAMSRIRQDGTRETLEYVAELAGGTRAFEARLTPVLGDQIIIVLRDVTEREAARSALELRTRQMIRQQSALQELARSGGDEPSTTFGRTVQVAAETLHVARASVWYLNQDRSEIHCAWLWRSGSVEPNPGITIRRGDFPAYFAALDHGVTIAATDAQRDPRTSEFTESYLGPLGIGAMLDCSIRVGGDVVGVLCLEHVGGPRTWTLEEEDFAAAVASFVALSRSLEDRRALEEQLRQSQKMEAIGVLAGGIAHDFNNLLTAILGFAELVQGDPNLSSAARTQVTEIARAGERASELTRQMLAFGRQQVRSPRVVGVTALLRGITPMLRRAVGESIDLRLHCAPTDIFVRVDANQMEQVLLNLVLNARDAISKGQPGSIEIRVEVVPTGPRGEGRGVRITVSDTGRGIPPEILPRVFDPFYTTKSVGEGSGLGLSMVYGLVQQNGGEVTLTSQVGVGTTASVLLEQVAAPDVEAAAVVAPQLPPRGTGTVLLVEDESVVRLLATQMLKRLGYTPLVAAHPREALALAENPSTSFDLLLTDLVMPEMTGRQLHVELQRHRPGLRAVYMSGYAPTGMLDIEELEPLTEFLAKPFTLKQLGEAVAAALGLVGAPGAPGP